MSNVVREQGGNTIIRLDTTTIATGLDCCCSGDVTVTCDTISASKTKCGFSVYSGTDNTKYLTQTIQSNGHCSFSPPPGESSPATGDWNSMATYTYDTTSCTSSCTSGSGSGHTNVPWTGAVCNSGSLSASCGGQSSPCGATPSVVIDSSTLAWIAAPDCGTGISFACFLYGLTGGGQGATSQTLFYDRVIAPDEFVHATAAYSLSNPYPTAKLIEVTIASLPAFPGTFSTPGPCAATRNLSSDESSFSVSRFIPKFSYMASPANRVVHYTQHSTVDGDTPMTLDAPANSTFVTGPEVYEPSSNGTVSITNATISSS